jgi:hypothetical protein
MQIKTIGIDLGKTACDLVATDGRGEVVSRRGRGWSHGWPICRRRGSAWRRRAASTTWRAGWPCSATT